MSMHDKEMLGDLVVESREHLAGVEPDLLELEQKGANVSDDLINRVFRAVHSIKGGFGFFGIEHVTHLAHDMENVLSRVRDKSLGVTPELVDALLSGVDKLRALLDDVGNADKISIEMECTKLAPFVVTIAASVVATARGTALSGADAAQSLGLDASIRQKHRDLTDAAVIGAIKNGMRLYQITLNSHTDLEDKGLSPVSLFSEWEKIGEILDITFDFDSITGLKGSSGTELVYSAVLASVLEPDLICAGTGIDAEQIHSIDTTTIRAQLRPLGQQVKAAASASLLAGATPVLSEPVEKTAGTKAETKIEDALRVKVSLLNNLMNLAGELVLSRNQLVQCVSRSVSEYLDTDRTFREFDRQVKAACDRVVEASRRDAASAQKAAETESERLRDVFRQTLSFKLSDLSGMRSVIQNIDLVTSMLQENIMQTRLQPISVLFSKFPRIVRDLAKKLGKDINLVTVGQDVELDRSIVELLADPLTHLVRNSVDHGVESVEKRVASGKPAQGEVVLRAFHEGGKVNIEIRDDGAGINTARVRQKAIEQKLVTAEAAAKMSDTEINLFIMAPGFSTAEIVSDVSGRGVGMDVVKTNIERLGGTIEVLSVPGRGTVITMQLPLTLAIISSLMVTAEGRRFAIPQVGVEELVRIRSRDIGTKIERVGRSEVYRLRGRLLPLVRLAGVLGMEPTFVNSATGIRDIDRRSRWSDRRGKREGDEEAMERAGDKASGRVGDRTSGRAEEIPAAQRSSTAESDRRAGPDRRESVRNAVKIVVLKSGDNHYGLVVDEVHDSEEIVVKPLSSYLKGCPCYAGSTIMGDGSVAMILDTNGISRLADLKFGDLEKENKAEQERLARENSRVFHDVLLFDNGAGERFGMELSNIARIEKVTSERIEIVGSREFLRYDETTLPIIRLQDYLPVAAPNAQKAHQFVIVPKVKHDPIGIVVDQVHDVVHTELNLDTKNVKNKGVQGSVVMNARMTLILDMQGLQESATERLG